MRIKQPLFGMIAAGVAFFALPFAALAASTVASVNAGGGYSSSANYALDASLGNIAGDATGGSVKIMAGGSTTQPAMATNLIVLATPSPMNETSTNQLSGVAILDDATVSVLSGADIGWSVVNGPIASINTSGSVIATAVYTDTLATVGGVYIGASNTVVFTVLDNNPDNYGIYASDGIPDAWQVRYFGENNPSGLASATNSTGQNNLYSFIADLNPTDPASCFAVYGLSNQPPGRVVCFRTTSTGRVYRLSYTTNLVNGGWADLPDATWTPGLAGQMSLSDTNAATVRFYRVHVQMQ